MEVWKDKCLVLDSEETVHSGILEFEFVCYPYGDDHVCACDSAELVNDAINKMLTGQTT